MQSSRREASIQRAMHSMMCLPFKKRFYEEVASNPMNSNELCNREDWDRYVFAPFGRQRAEEHFEWMIRLGILRHEVDGQGLTDRVRLTPLGQELINRISGEIPRAGIRGKIKENLKRHSRLV